MHFSSSSSKSAQKPRTTTRTITITIWANSTRRAVPPKSGCLPWAWIPALPGRPCAPCPCAQSPGRCRFPEKARQSAAVQKHGRCARDAPAQCQCRYLESKQNADHDRGVLARKSPRGPFNVLGEVEQISRLDLVFKGGRDRGGHLGSANASGRQPKPDKHPCRCLSPSEIMSQKRHVILPKKLRSISVG